MWGCHGFHHGLAGRAMCSPVALGLQCVGHPWRWLGDADVHFKATEKIYERDKSVQLQLTPHPPWWRFGLRSARRPSLLSLSLSLLCLPSSIVCVSVTAPLAHVCSLFHCRYRFAFLSLRLPLSTPINLSIFSNAGGLESPRRWREEHLHLTLSSDTDAQYGLTCCSASSPTN